MNAKISRNQRPPCVMENLEGRQFFSATTVERDPTIPPPTEVTHSPYLQDVAGPTGSIFGIDDSLHGVRNH